MGITNQLPSSRLAQPGVIDNAAARPAAPYEGTLIFQKDTDQLLVWNGTAWVIPNSPAQNPTGLEFVSSTTFSNVASATLSSCFSATYDTYRVSINAYSNISASGRYCHLQLTSGGTATTSGYYSKSMWIDIAAGSSTFVDYDVQTTKFCLGALGFVNAGEGSYDVDIHYPFASRNTRMTGGGTGLMAAAYYTGAVCNGLQTGTASFDGIKLLPNADNITGTIAVYGYRK